MSRMPAITQKIIQNEIQIQSAVFSKEAPATLISPTDLISTSANLPDSLVPLLLPSPSPGSWSRAGNDMKSDEKRHRKGTPNR